MDFTKLGTLLDDQETWLHLEIAGKPLYLEGDGPTIEKNDSPMRVKLRGVSAPAVVKYLKEIERHKLAYDARIARANDKQIDSIAAGFQTKLDAMMTRAVVAAIVDWENITFEGEIQKPTPEYIARLVDPEKAQNDRDAFVITAIRGQIYAHITEQRGLFTDAARAS